MGRTGGAGLIEWTNRAAIAGCRLAAEATEVGVDAGEAGVVRPHPFGVELHGGDGIALRLDGFDDAVLGTGAHIEAGGDVLHGLVMGGVGDDAIDAQHLMEARTLRDTDGMVDVAVPAGRGDLRGDVLVEGAAEEHVDDLLAPAGAEDGFAELDGLGKDTVLEGVATLVDAAQRRTGLFAKARGVDILASRQEHHIDRLQQLTEREAVEGAGDEDGGVTSVDQGTAIDVVEGVVGREPTVVHQPHDELACTQLGGAGKQRRKGQQKIDDSFHADKNSYFFVIIRLIARKKIELRFSSERR